MKYLIFLLLLGLTPEEKSAKTAAEINASYQTKSEITAVEVNKKVWVLTEAPKTVAWNTRAPVGHTHTCQNGHTWDHQLSASHNCPFCGQFQNIQDRSPRPVTVQTFPSDCPNGQCQYIRRVR